MKTKEQIKKWLLENCVSESGKLDLSGLDFSDFDETVDISKMKVKKNLLQNKHICHNHHLLLFYKVFLHLLLL